MSYTACLMPDQAPPRRPGPPSADEDPGARLTKVGVLLGRQQYGRTVKQEAERLGVSTRTIKRWTKRAKSYPETAALMPEE